MPPVPGSGGRGPGRRRRALTHNVDVGAGQDGAVHVRGFALVHGRVVGLQVGEADFTGGDDVPGERALCQGSKGSGLIEHGT